MASIQNPSSTSTIYIEEEEEIIMTAEEVQAMKKSILTNLMEMQWDYVLTEYKKPKIQELKITRSGDTILHLAVISYELEIVEKLVKLISDDNLSKILKLKNNKGNTVLHIAATDGYLEMCDCIVGSNPSLIGERNDDNETPLFLAASLGWKDVFTFLRSRCGSICDETNGLPYWRKSDGETVLHCAITGENFDLAYEIIQLNGDLVNCINGEGLSPLHILANKPNVFKGGNSLSRFDLLIYHCMLVDNPEDSNSGGAKNFDEENGSKFFPRNCQICLALPGMLRKLIKVIALSVINKHGPKTDTENPELVQKTSAGNTMAFLAPPPNMYSHTMSFYFFKLVTKTLFGIAALLHCSSRLDKIKDKKETNNWATRVMKEMIKRASGKEYDTYVDDLQTSIPPPNAAADPPQETKAKKEKEKIESPILIAAKMGVLEMVVGLLEKFPLAIHDMNAENKNIVMLAVENRQTHVFNHLLKRIVPYHFEFEQMDNKGNSVLHLAATLGESRPWLMPGAALQMQSEIRWYKFVKHSIYYKCLATPKNFVLNNKEGKTAKQVFSETHKDLLKEGGQWLTNTSQSCSVVAALIATVAFATAATVPGGLNSTTGAPTFATKPAFKAFTIASLAALCFSVTSVIMFLAILTSGYEEKQFANDLPNKLIVALFSLVISIVSMLVSFCVGQVFVLHNHLIYAAYPFYILTSLPVAFFVLFQFPLIDMIKATLREVPKRNVDSKGKRLGRP